MEDKIFIAEGLGVPNGGFGSKMGGVTGAEVTRRSQQLFETEVGLQHGHKAVMTTGGHKNLVKQRHGHGFLEQAG